MIFTYEGSIVHHGAQVVRYSGADFTAWVFLEVPYGIWFDVLCKYVDVGISVRTRLFMIKSKIVANLMYNGTIALL